MHNKLCDNIRLFRKERLLTQEQLAEAMGVSVGAVSKWELGQSMPEINMLMELADFFDVSVDVLLDCKMRGNDRERIVERLKAQRQEKNFSWSEAEKALKKHPNCFDIVYNSAILYQVGGIELRDHRLLSRAVELLGHACRLIDQNQDEHVSELSIRIEIAKTYLPLDEPDKAIAQLKKYNPCGVNNDQIGFTLATACQKTDEALPYLSDAMIDSICTLMRVVIGYVNVFVHQQDFRAALDVIGLIVPILGTLKCPGKTNFLEKYEAVMLVICAFLYVKGGKMEPARDYLRRAIEAARHFDAAPNYSALNVRFYFGSATATAYDDLGDTAMEGIKGAFTASDNDPKLMALWEEILNEDKES